VVGTTQHQVSVAIHPLAAPRSFYGFINDFVVLFGWLYPAAQDMQKIANLLQRRTNIKKQVTVHTLRLSFATHLLENKTDIRSIQQLPGHSSIKTTMIYTHITPKAAKNIISALDRLLPSPPMPKGLK
jgi:integrase